jgi:signal transduction histidine kinase/CheY-like chemotaxis protein
MGEVKQHSSFEPDWQIRRFEFLKNIILSGSGDLNSYLDNLLSETIKLTDSLYGYIFSYSPSFENFIIRSHFGDGLPENVSRTPENITRTVCSGAWHDALDNKNVLINNNNSRFIFLLNEEIVEKDVNCFCSLPIVTVSNFIACIVLCGKPRGYSIPDYELQNTVVEPVIRIIVNLLTIEELAGLKELAEIREHRRNIYLKNSTHEIKTPLNALSGFTRLLKEPGLDEENRRKYTDIIIQSSDNLSNLIRNFSEVWEVESGKIMLTTDEIDLTVLAEDVYARFTREAVKKNLIFENRFEVSDEDSNIFGDITKLEKILIVLLTNAFKYTFSGKITLGCKLVQGEIEFSVSDTGIGMSEQSQSELFKYSVSGNSLVKASAGSGMGLFLAKAWVERMGGQIWYVTAEGKGSTFRFTIPHLQYTETKSVQKSRYSEVVAADTRKKTILVAEDDHLNFYLIKSFLSTLDVNIIRAENGREAVDLYNLNKVDLVLMDIRMPEMDGYTASKIIKESNPAQIVIAQTAYSNDRSVAIMNGCDDFIAKPFEMKKFIAMISGYLF